MIHYNYVHAGLIHLLVEVMTWRCYRQTREQYYMYFAVHVDFQRSARKETTLARSPFWDLLNMLRYLFWTLEASAFRVVQEPFCIYIIADFQGGTKAKRIRFSTSIIMQEYTFLKDTAFTIYLLHVALLFIFSLLYFD